MSENDRVEAQAPEKQAPAWVHEQHLGAPRAVNDLTIDQNVSNFVGSSISLPGTWERQEHDIGAPRHIVTFSNGTDSAQLSLYDRGKDVRGDSAKYLHDLLAANADIKEPKSLTPDQIKNLYEVMGTTNAGDNQYVNSHKPPDPQSPAFDLKSAELVSVNGKTVLQVRGNYFDSNGQPGKQYEGIFVPTGSAGASIKEFFLQADDKKTLDHHKQDYENALNSIKW